MFCKKCEKEVCTRLPNCDSDNSPSLDNICDCTEEDYDEIMTPEGPKRVILPDDWSKAERAQRKEKFYMETTAVDADGNITTRVDELSPPTSGWDPDDPLVKMGIRAVPLNFGAGFESEVTKEYDYVLSEDAKQSLSNHVKILQALCVFRDYLVKHINLMEIPTTTLMEFDALFDQFIKHDESV